MGRSHVPDGPGVVGRRMLLLLVAAGRGVLPRPGVQDRQAHVRESLIAAEQGPEELDAVAGCEYVDDRIRRQE